MKRLLLIALLPLGACQTTSLPSNAPVPELPTDYRGKLAVRLLENYMADGAGPAEITREVQSRPGLFRGTTVVTLKVRYPVLVNQAAQTLGKYHFLRDLAVQGGKSDARQRCIDLTVDVTEREGGDPSVTLNSRRLKVDPVACGGWNAWVPFPELNALAASVKACRERGERVCPLSVPGDATAPRGAGAAQAAARAPGAAKAP